MNTEQAYDQWSTQYDGNENKTRDLEGNALKDMLAGRSFRSVLELGCGTGKNTLHLLECGEHITAVDLSEEMLRKAQSKIASPRVEFIRSDINGNWEFGRDQFDLITISLVLEHIENLQPVFKKVAESLAPGGLVYLGELHPSKQYIGSKARFETENGIQVVQCFTHHTSDFMHAAQENGLEIVALDEYFDDNDRSSVPRILALIFRKTA
ncbi:MAG TPA: class I SAM-dependent methyltransferase [Sphingobacteriaceae bacterium]